MTQDNALDILKTGANAFLTGEPGAGKTHTINQYVAWLRAHGLEPAVTASTGIAATHMRGMTIHSWSGIGIRDRLSSRDIAHIAGTDHVARRIRRANVLIIDEISMLGPRALDSVDAVCRAVRADRNPFGGLQVVFVGDFFQLPPVTKRREETEEGLFHDEADDAVFSYQSAAWAAADPVICYLSEQHRQDDREFLAVLGAIRRNAFGAEHLAHIAKRRVTRDDLQDDIPKLYSRNVNVDRVNAEALARLPGTAREFAMTAHGAPPLVLSLKKSCLSPEKLALKKGAVVMFTKNNPKEGFVNGTLGIVESFDGPDGQPIVKTKSGERIAAAPMEWAIDENGSVRAAVVQVPLRLAWALTVHKSQGVSLDAAIMDLSDAFEYGQGYVALSRVRRLSGLHILGWNARAFQVHPDVSHADAGFRARSDIAREAVVARPREKLAAEHKRFVEESGGSPEGGVVAKPKKKIVRGSTLEETLSLLKEGKDIAAIAKERGFSETTIVAHLSQLHEQKKITAADVKALVPAALKKGLPEIRAAFKALGGEWLGPVHEKLKGKYSFDELRLARMLNE